MKTIRKLLFRDIIASVLFVSLAFLALFFFIDFVDALEAVGTKGQGPWQAFQATLLELPKDFYELFPIAVLIGTIYSLARMAQSSEFTILRTGGLGPGRALGLLTVLGLLFAMLTFVVGDFIAPSAQRQAVLLKAGQGGSINLAGAGAWLKEKRSSPSGDRSFSVNVGGVSGAGRLIQIRIFEFDSQGRLVSRVQAREGRVKEADTSGASDSLSVWTLTDVESTQWPQANATGQTQVKTQRQPTAIWHSTLTAAVVEAAVLPVGTMSTLELWRYSAHLTEQEQASQTHLIRFWRKALYPLACVVIVALALPFAYMNARAGGVSFKVFGGVMLGISYVLLSNLSGHLGMLRGWTPWVAAATPSIVYTLLSMGAFAWLVRYR
jgi:lipopolysaccharide export system permease protein